jgi:HK97 family phage major capsid protein
MKTYSALLADIGQKRLELTTAVGAHEKAAAAQRPALQRRVKTIQAELDSLIEDYDAAGYGRRQVDISKDQPGWAEPDRPGTIRAIKSAEKFADSFGGSTPVTLDAYLRAALTGEWGRLPDELWRGTAAKAAATDALGDLTLPAVLTNRVVDLTRARSQVIRAGALTARMQALSEIIARVVTAPTPAWKAENALIAEGDITFEPVTLTARTLAARAVLSVELSDDVPTVGDALEAELAAALASELDRAALDGSGTPPEPRGLMNTSGVSTQDTSLGLPGGYADFSRAVQFVREANHEPTGILLGPDVIGELDRLTDTTGQPLRPPESYADLPKFPTTKLAGIAVVGDWTRFLVAIRQELRIEATRQATDENNLGFPSYSVLVRATLRADFAVLKPAAFQILTDFATGS